MAAGNAGSLAGDSPGSLARLAYCLPACLLTSSFAAGGAGEDELARPPTGRNIRPWSRWPTRAESLHRQRHTPAGLRRDPGATRATDLMAPVRQQSAIRHEQHFVSLVTLGQGKGVNWLHRAKDCDRCDGFSHSDIPVSMIKAFSIQSWSQNREHYYTETCVQVYKLRGPL